MFRVLLVLALCLSVMCAPLWAQDNSLRPCDSDDLIDFTVSIATIGEWVSRYSDLASYLADEGADKDFVDAFVEFREDHYYEFLPMLEKLPLCREAVDLYLAWRDWMTRVELVLMGIPVDLPAANDRLARTLKLSTEWVDDDH